MTDAKSDELPPAEVYRRVQTSAELYRDSRREWRWRLRASNGRILATSSEGYRRKDDCLNGLMLTTQPPAKVRIEGDEP